jgi:hypothetical protein
MMSNVYRGHLEMAIDTVFFLQVHAQCFVYFFSIPKALLALSSIED